MSRESLSVLVADDDEDDRSYIRKAWDKGRAANDLRFVEDGEELIEYSCEENNRDLVNGHIK